VFDNCKNSKKQGDLGLGIAISYFSSLGYTVSLPLTDSQDYDLIVDIGELKRVQVKTTSNKNPWGNFTADFRTMGGNQKKYWVKKLDKSKVEFLFILTSEGTKYLIPTKELKGNSTVTLGKVYDQFKIGSL